MIENRKSELLIIRDAILDVKTFRRMTMTGQIRDASSPWIKVVVRPVIKKDRPHLQFMFFDGKGRTTRNYEGKATLKPLDEVLALPFLQIQVQTIKGDLQLRITQTGKIEFTRKPPVILTHTEMPSTGNKHAPLSKDKSTNFLKMIDVLDAAGRVKPTMQTKYRQINAFIKRLEMLIHDGIYEDGHIHIIDCGCGNADLTFSAYHYLTHARHLKPHIIGIDRNGEVIEKCRMLREALKWPGLDFYANSIGDYTPDKSPDLVLSLHARNVATDEAIARGIQWNSKSIVVAPCRHEDIHHQIKSPVVQPMLRDGALKDKTGEIIKDAIRAQVLRIMGYKTGVVDFEYPIPFSNNLMIRAEKFRIPGDPQMIQEYLDMVHFWHMEPRLQRLLGDSFTQLIDQYDRQHSGVA